MWLANHTPPPVKHIPLGIVMAKYIYTYYCVGNALFYSEHNKKYVKDTFVCANSKNFDSCQQKPASSETLLILRVWSIIKLQGRWPGFLLKSFVKKLRWCNNVFISDIMDSALVLSFIIVMLFLYKLI